MSTAKIIAPIQREPELLGQTVIVIGGSIGSLRTRSQRGFEANAGSKWASMSRRASSKSKSDNAA
jgi:hypothetical protein